MNQTSHYQIAKMVKLFESETQPFRKVHRLIDLFETIIKTHTTVIVSDYFRSKNISDRVKGMLVEGLRVPSLGIWQMFSRETLKEMKSKKEEPSEKGEASFFIEDFDRYFKKWAKPVDSKIIAFRNSYAHGATPSDEECQKDIGELTPVLEEMLSAEWLSTTALVVFRRKEKRLALEDLEGFRPPLFGERKISDILTSVVEKNGVPLGGHPYLIRTDDAVLDLFPLMAYRGEGEGKKDYLVFFNDLKRKHEVGLLNYPESLHLRDDELYDEFTEKIPLDEWKKIEKRDEFKDRIAEFTEVFKGRVRERKLIAGFKEDREKGSLFVFGPPGIGKSALLAKALSAPGADEGVNEGVEEGQEQTESTGHERENPVIRYFIRRGTVYSDPSWFLNYLHQELDNKVKTGIEKGGTLEEKKANLHTKLAAAGEQLSGAGRKLILVIDGLDEGTEKGIFGYLPAGVYPGVLIIYSSRPIDESVALFDALPPEEKERLDLGGLKENDIRAILYDSSDKYALKDDYIKKVAEQSGGNPLYMKMLCYSLETGEIDINDTAALPPGIEEFYRGFIRRFAARGEGEPALKLLYLFAAAEDYLSTGQIYQILKEEGMSLSELEKGIIALSEVLLERPGREEGYQLFHESFRNFIRERKGEMVLRAEEGLLRWCARWKEMHHMITPGKSLEESDLRSAEADHALYAARYYSTHLRRLDKKEELLILLREGEYAAFQKSVTRQYDEGFRFFLDLLQTRGTSFDEAVEASAAAGRHHLDLLNSYEEVRELAVKEDRYREGMNRAMLFPAGERFFLLLDLLYNLLFRGDASGKGTGRNTGEGAGKGPGEDTEKDRELIGELLQRVTEASGDGWKDKVGFSLIWEMALRLRDMGIDPEPLISSKEESEEDNEIAALLAEVGTTIPVEISPDLFVEKIDVGDPETLELLARFGEEELTAATAEKLLRDKGPSEAGEYAAAHLTQGSEVMSKCMLSVCREHLRAGDNEGAAAWVGYLLADEWIAGVLEIAALEHSEGKEKDCAGSWSVITAQARERLNNGDDGDAQRADWHIKAVEELVRQDRIELAEELCAEIPGVFERGTAARGMALAYAEKEYREKAEELLRSSLEEYRRAAEKELFIQNIRHWVESALKCGLSALAEEWNGEIFARASEISNAIYRSEALQFGCIMTARLGNPPEAMEKVFGLITSPQEREGAFRYILGGYPESFQAEVTEKSVLGLLSEDQRDSYASFAGAVFLSQGKEDAAERFFKGVVNKKQILENCIALEKNLREERKGEEGDQASRKVLLRKALEIMESDEILVKDAEIRVELAESLLRAGEKERAEETAEEFFFHLPDAPYDRTRGLKRLSNLFYCLDKKQRMEKTLAAALIKRDYLPLENIWFIRTTLSNYAETLIEQGGSDSLFAFIEASPMVYIFQTVINTLFNAGREEEALQTAKLAAEAFKSGKESGNVRDNCSFLQQLAVIMVSAGRTEEAVKYVEEAAELAAGSLPGGSDRFEALNESALNLLHLGRREKAGELAVKCVKELDFINEQYLRLSNVEQTAQVLIGAGMGEEARDLLSVEMEPAETARVFLDNGVPLLLDQGEIGEAKKLIALVDEVLSAEEKEKPEVKAFYSAAYADTGMFETAEEVLTALHGEYEERNAVAHLAAALARRGEAEKAKEVVQGLELAPEDAAEFEGLQNSLLLIALSFLEEGMVGEAAELFKETAPNYFPSQYEELDEQVWALFTALAEAQPELLLERIDASENPLAIGFISAALVNSAPDDTPEIDKTHLEELAWRAVLYIQGDTDLVTRADGNTEKMRLLRLLIKTISPPERVLEEMQKLEYPGERVETFYSLLREIGPEGLPRELVTKLLGLEDDTLSLHIASALPEWTETALAKVFTHGLYKREILGEALYSAAVYLGFAAEDERKAGLKVNHLLTLLSWAMDISAFAAAEPTPGGGDAYSLEDMNGWIETVEDEDDRDQIELWARRVKKGKLTEEKFSKRVEELIG